MNFDEYLELARAPLLKFAGTEFPDAHSNNFFQRVEVALLFASWGSMLEPKNFHSFMDFLIKKGEQGVFVKMLYPPLNRDSNFLGGGAPPRYLPMAYVPFSYLQSFDYEDFWSDNFAFFSMNYVVYSSIGTWGFVGTEDDAILGGPRELINKWTSLAPHIADEIYNFVDYYKWQRNSELARGHKKSYSWVEEHLVLAYGDQRAREVLDFMKWSETEYRGNVWYRDLWRNSA